MSFPPGVTLSLVEAQGFQVLAEFLEAYCQPSTVTVVRAVGQTAPGQNVRVPEPIAGDFIIMSSLSQDRLATNLTIYSDNVFTGSIAGTTLTVAEVTHGTLGAGQLLTDSTWPFTVAAGTTILAQLTGSPPGGIGTYRVSVSQTLPAETLYAGTRSDALACRWTAQLDVHGPGSADNARVISTLFRSEVATSFFEATGLAVEPLHCDDARQIPFENAEQAIEWRWVMDAAMQVTPVTTVPQQYAAAVKVNLIQAYTSPAAHVPQPVYLRDQYGNIVIDANGYPVIIGYE